MSSEIEIKSMVDALSWEQQMKLYVIYLCSHLKLKYSASINWIGETYYPYPYPENYKYPKGYGKPDEIKGQLHYRYLWNEISIMTFSEFIDKNRFITHDLSSYCKEQGFARPHQYQLTGIYEYYQRFSNNLK